MRYGSVCSGIEAASLAWEPLGWQAAWFAEIEKFPSQVLAHRWPTVPNLGDMCQLPALIRSGQVEAPDILVGGTPCQAYSVAGKREGLSDSRGQLTLTYVEVADAIDSQRPDSPCIVVWENVPGVLSSKDNAFGCFLGDLVGEDCPLEPPGGKWSNAGCVYGPTRTAAWRVIDAQYFGVAQRRRRVFVVASAREGFNPTEVLFEREGLRRDFAPSRETWQETPCFTPSSINAYRAGVGSLRANGGDNGGVVRTLLSAVSTLDASYGKLQGCLGQDLNNAHDHLVVCYAIDNEQNISNSNEAIGPLMKDSPTGGGRPLPAVLCYGGNNTNGPIDVATARNACESPTGRLDFESETFVLGFQQNQLGEVRTGDIAGTINTNSNASGRNTPMIAFNWNAQPDQMNFSTDTTSGLTCSQGAAVLLPQMSVRRLTPMECERLQGMPDNHTAIPSAADGPRYKSIGNSKAVPCVTWLGQRIARSL